MEIMLVAQVVIVLLASLYVLVKGADYFVKGAEKLGLACGLRQFVIGVLIVGMGTSLPELASSIAGVLAGENEIVIANVVGSNIANILLVVGMMAFIGGPILIKQRLLQTELPIFIIAVIHFVAVVYDGVIDRAEGLLLVATFGAYMWYIFYDSQSEDELQDKAVESDTTAKITWQVLVMVIGGLLAVLIGAHFTVQSAVDLATMFGVSVAFISITAIAIGTSLPELVVCLQAIRSKRAEMAIGNIFGSSAFNMLAVAGFPALYTPLVANALIMDLGLGVMVAASIILFVSGLARQVMRWEGLMMLFFFAFFLGKLLTLI